MENASWALCEHKSKARTNVLVIDCCGIIALSGDPNEMIYVSVNSTQHLEMIFQ